MQPDGQWGCPLRQRTLKEAQLCEEDCGFDLGSTEIELPLRLPHGKIKLRVRSVSLELREEVGFGDINCHVLYREVSYR